MRAGTAAGWCSGEGCAEGWRSLDDLGFGATAVASDLWKLAKGKLRADRCGRNSDAAMRIQLLASTRGRAHSAC
eukprot:5085286-Prymnesium_polylepis.1